MFSSIKCRFYLMGIMISLLLTTPTIGCLGAARSKQAKNNGQKIEKKKDPRKDPDQIGNRDVGKGFNFYSIEKEIALGKKLAQEIEKQVKLIDNPIVSEYINRVGQNLVRNSDAKVPFTIKVIDSDDINAFALPGGFFFVNTGLILKTETEAELAGVMAHEIAHVAARHGTRNASKAELTNWLTIPLIFLGGPIGFGIRSATGILIPMKFLQFSRGAEREADFLGLQYLYKTGYDPRAVIDFFERIQLMEKNRPGTISKLFSTHPMTNDRIEASQKAIEEILPEMPQYVISTSEFGKVKAKLVQLQIQSKGEKEEKEGPTLRRKRKASNTEEQDEDENKTRDEDERPTLKR